MRLRFGGLEGGWGCFAALLFCGCAGAPDPPPAAGPDELLRHVHDSLADGYFESAWRGLHALHAHPRRNELRPPLVFIYFQNTPTVGTLAALLDKKASEAGDYASYCPDALVNKERCSRHAAPEAAWFDEAPVGSEIVRQTLPLKPMWIKDDSPWALPAVTVGLPEEDIALVDTGTTVNNLTSNAWARSPDMGERIGTAGAGTQLGVVEAPLVRLHTLRLGEATFRRIAAHLGVARINIVGMTVLLRHDAVCFDWAREELVLGSLGRCAGGHVVDEGVWLPHNLRMRIDLAPPHVELPHERLAMQGVVDTGDHQTRCSEMFLKLNGGPKFFIGGHPDLVGTCVHDKGRDVLESENPTHFVEPLPVLIGMDTLRRFDAFGWRLRPLRLYFLPPKEGAQP